MKKSDILASMTFSDDYIPSQFTKEELEALKAVSSNWDATNINQSMDIVWAIRGIN